MNPWACEICGAEGVIDIAWLDSKEPKAAASVACCSRCSKASQVRSLLQSKLTREIKRLSIAQLN